MEHRKTTERSRKRCDAVYWSLKHRQWRMLVLHRDPLCVICHVNTSTVADHIVALTDGGGWALDNGQGMCQSCHGAKSNAEMRGTTAPLPHPFPDLL